jgi:hypothetical protein
MHLSDSLVATDAGSAPPWNWPSASSSWRSSRAALLAGLRARGRLPIRGRTVCVVLGRQCRGEIFRSVLATARRLTMAGPPRLLDTTAGLALAVLDGDRNRRWPSGGRCGHCRYRRGPGFGFGWMISATRSRWLSGLQGVVNSLMVAVPLVWLSCWRAFALVPSSLARALFLISSFYVVVIVVTM